jgi:hypothetical protein
MTKKVTSKKDKGEEQAKPASPHIAFTESELRDVTGFLNDVWTKAKFEMTMSEFREFDKSFTRMSQHRQKLNEYVLEVKKITQQPKDS